MVDFHVLCLQVVGGRKISEVQVRVCYYWHSLLSFTEVQVKFVLEDAVFQSCFKTMLLWY